VSRPVEALLWTLLARPVYVGGQMVRFVAVVVLLGGLGIATPAFAQSAEAEAMFNEGDKLMAAGKLAEACAAFEASNNMDPRAGTLIRLGECREANKQLASAWTAYRGGLTRAKDPRKRDIAQAKVTALEPRLSHLTIVVGANKVDGLAITRDGKPVDPVTWDRSLPVDGGDYTIVAKAPGFEDWKTSVSVPPEQGDVKVELPALVKSATPPPQPPKPPTTTDDDDAAPRLAPGMFTPKRKIALGLGGAAVASLAVGVVLGITAKGKHDDAFKLCPDPDMPCADASKAEKLAASSHTLGIGADVAFGVAAAAAIGAGVLWFTGKPEVITPTRNGVAVVGRF
jgi:hypothetical protein